MLTRLLAVVMTSMMLVGCASVPMDRSEKASMAKNFKPPANGNAGLYIYRYGSMGAALKKDIWLDGKCVGESAPNTFFYQEVKGNAQHTVSTESEFSANDLLIKTDAGKNYFVRQYIKFGLVVGGAGLEAVSEEKGIAAVQKLGMAQNGRCSKSQ